MKKLILLFTLIILANCGNPLSDIPSQSGESSSQSPDSGGDTDPDTDPETPPPAEEINTAPTISAVATQTIQANSAANTVDFQIDDDEQNLNCASSLMVTSNNAAVLDTADVSLSGTAPNCTATLNPKANQYGDVELTFLVSDGTLTANTSFTVDVLGNPTLVSNLTVWLDAADESTVFTDNTCTTAAVNDGDPVGCWQDKTAGGNHATMSVASQKPSLNLVTNQSSIEFDGNNDYFDDFHNFTGRTVFIIYRMDSTLQPTSDLAQLWGFYARAHVAPDARNLGLWSFDGNVGTTAQYAVDGNSLAAATTGSNAQPWSYNTFEMVRTVFTSNQVFTRQVIGSLVPNFPVGSHQLGGQISEILVFSSTLSAGDTELMEGYLACKWNLQANLPMAHPFKTNCP